MIKLNLSYHNGREKEATPRLRFPSRLSTPEHTALVYSIGKIICRDRGFLRLYHRAGSCRPIPMPAAARGPEQPLRSSHKTQSQAWRLESQSREARWSCAAGSQSLDRGERAGDAVDGVVPKRRRGRSGATTGSPGAPPKRGHRGLPKRRHRRSAKASRPSECEIRGNQVPPQQEESREWMVSDT